MLSFVSFFLSLSVSLIFRAQSISRAFGIEFSYPFVHFSDAVFMLMHLWGSIYIITLGKSSFDADLA